MKKGSCDSVPRVVEVCVCSGCGWIIKHPPIVINDKKFHHKGCWDKFCKEEKDVKSMSEVSDSTDSSTETVRKPYAV